MIILTTSKLSTNISNKAIVDIRLHPRSCAVFQRGDLRIRRTVKSVQPPLNIRLFLVTYCAFIALTLLVWSQEEHPTCKNWVMRCWRCWCGFLPGARCRLFAYGPADAYAIPKHHHLLPHVLEKRPLKGGHISSSKLRTHCSYDCHQEVNNERETLRVM